MAKLRDLMPDTGLTELMTKEGKTVLEIIGETEEAPGVEYGHWERGSYCLVPIPGQPGKMQALLSVVIEADSAWKFFDFATEMQG